MTLPARSRMGSEHDLQITAQCDRKLFKAFLGRQQYGTHSSWPRRGDFWSYQLNIHAKYFLEQFPFYDSFAATFRRAVPSGQTADQIQVFSIIPFLFGAGGMVYHCRNDWRRFASVLSMFALMGLGLVLYLNMPDPEPREREYIFVGAYTFCSGTQAKLLLILSRSWR